MLKKKEFLRIIWQEMKFPVIFLSIVNIFGVIQLLESLWLNHERNNHNNNERRVHETVFLCFFLSIFILVLIMNIIKCYTTRRLVLVVIQIMTILSVIFSLYSLKKQKKINFSLIWVLNFINNVLAIYTHCNLDRYTVSELPKPPPFLLSATPKIRKREQDTRIIEELQTLHNTAV